MREHTFHQLSGGRIVNRFRRRSQRNPEWLQMRAQRKVIGRLTGESRAVAVAKLPSHHRDPFDRILVAQTLQEPARLLTVDGPLQQYSDLVEIVRS